MYILLLPDTVNVRPLDIRSDSLLCGSSAIVSRLHWGAAIVLNEGLPGGEGSGRGLAGGPQP